METKSRKDYAARRWVIDNIRLLLTEVFVPLRIWSGFLYPAQTEHCKFVIVKANYDLIKMILVYNYDLVFKLFLFI